MFRPGKSLPFITEQFRAGLIKYYHCQIIDISLTLQLIHVIGIIGFRSRTGRLDSDGQLSAF